MTDKDPNSSCELRPNDADIKEISNVSISCYSPNNMAKIGALDYLKQAIKCYNPIGIIRYYYQFGYVDKEYCDLNFKKFYQSVNQQSGEPKFVMESLYHENPTSVGCVWDLRDDLPAMYRMRDIYAKYGAQVMEDLKKEAKGEIIK
ncbi:hypothetical protein ROZALSC1DRAFT_30323 [Rozella allomycis CSF55]|uniref:Uncharacterized protein n=1 Tax=Rozella allomycis (strain CSF55) TaxID=988480 RepID=A0A075AR39_ROZAC|nr:hypothetical protein O9G_004562 [Rozella allomycis CSF55]RKP17916.1 hypothetical protein ROZALSC1DRAFT_30323 [Rozella allomycis CSF55]|eukprot:EPZ32610.1 hypothetical protein O9G_004562 [Rozella allomycis CSF55]